MRVSHVALAALAASLLSSACDLSSSSAPEDELPFDVLLRNSSNDVISIVGEGEDHATSNLLQPGEFRTFVVREADRGQMLFFFAALNGDFSSLFGPGARWLGTSTIFCTYDGPSGERREVVYVGQAAMNCVGW